MPEWSEEEIRDRRLMAPCGLYCGACGIYIATRDKNEKFRGVMANLYGTKPEDTECLGCMQKDPPEKMYLFCRMCAIRECVLSKGLMSCQACAGWPCDKITGFPFATGRRVMERTIPLWREKVAALGEEEGSVAWARSECRRYHCPSCGQPVFRGAQRCKACKTPLADVLDGSL